MPNTCGGCDAEWTGNTRPAHCGRCHQTFAGVGTFDRHRTATGPHGTCTHPATLPGIEYRRGMWREPQQPPNTWTHP